MSTHRNINSQKDVLINNLEISDFVEYYGNLFSNKDRPNSLNHDGIETDLSDYHQEINIQEFSRISFKEFDIRNAIKTTMSIFFANFFNLNKFKQKKYLFIDPQGFRNEYSRDK